MKPYPEREIFAYGRYIQCQILNWNEGPPPPYIICNPLDREHREEFIARQGMGTWMRVDLREIVEDLEQHRSGHESSLRAIGKLLLLCDNNSLGETAREVIIRDVSGA